MKSKQVKAVAYVKAGGIADHRNYTSIHRQLDLIEDYAGNNKIEIDIIVDVMGREDSEFKLAEVYGYCENDPKIKYVLVSHFNRISRKADDFHYWKQQFNSLGVEIKSATQAYDNVHISRLFEDISTMLGEIDSNKRSLRFKTGIRNKKVVKG